MVMNNRMKIKTRKSKKKKRRRRETEEVDLGEIVVEKAINIKETKNQRRKIEKEKKIVIERKNMKNEKYF